MPAAAFEPSAASVQFIPVELAAAATATDEAAAPGSSDIHIELTRGGTQLCVRWPSSEAPLCAAWLRELAVALKE